MSDRQTDDTRRHVADRSGEELLSYATEMLKARLREQTANTLDAVFTSRSDTWVSPGNFTTRLQQAFAAYPELKGVTPKVFRSTIATAVKSAPKVV